MSKIVKREKKDMSILDYSSVKESVVQKIFDENPLEIIYIEKKDELFGIITLGDYSRHMDNRKTKMIKENFKFFQKDKEDEITEFFKIPGNKIRAVPIVDENNKVLYEYLNGSKEYGMQESRAKDFFKKLKKEKRKLIIENVSKIIDLFEIGNIFIIENKYTDKYLINEIYKLFCEVGEKVPIQNKIIDRLLEDEYIESSDVLIIDVNEAGYKSRNERYSKNFIQCWGIGNLIDILNSEFVNQKNNKICQKIINYIGSYFNKVAIYGRNRISTKMMEIFNDREMDVIYIDDENFEWDEKSKTFYMKDANFERRIIIFCNLISTAKNIKYEGKKIYISSLLNVMCGYVEHRTYSSHEDIDIIYNIIPQFEENNCKYLILDATYDENRLLVKNKLQKKIEIALKKDTGLGIVDIFLSECELEESRKFSGEEGLEICKEISKSIYVQDGAIRKSRLDYNGKYIKSQNGNRYTCGNDNVNSKKIFMFGPCIVFGMFVKDCDTITSLIQKQVTEGYNVINKGDMINANNLRLREIDYNENDIILIMPYDIDLYKENNIKTYSLTDAYNRVENLNDCILDTVFHCNHIVNASIADEIVKILRENNYLDDAEIVNPKKLSFGNKGFDKELYKEMVSSNVELSKWMKNLEKAKVNIEGKIGSIVMNCNPFTNGHRYLIEEALKQIEYLYIFVVEEDKSYFKFEDRFNMVLEGTKDLENIKVLPSGKYMISTVTLPGYFNKENNPTVDVDATQDLNMFANIIAPTLGITVRFAGEEPIDVFTRQYNESMKEILPENDMEFVEIPRKEYNDNPISASIVRKYLKENKIEEIKKIVPESTYRKIER